MSRVETLNHWQQTMTQAIELSEHMLRHAEADDWDAFFAIAEQRESYVATLEASFDDIIENRQPDVGKIQGEMTRLFDLNQGLLRVCGEQKKEFQQALIQSKQFKKVSNQYKQFAR